VILPSTDSGAILCLIISLLCLGSWANLLKAGTGRPPKQQGTRPGSAAPGSVVPASSSIAGTGPGRPPKQQGTRPESAAPGSVVPASSSIASGKWRYELFYLDFSLGAGVVAVLAALTLGSLNSKELTFQDNLLIAGYRKVAYAAAAGAVANAANLLLAGAISVLPLSVAYLIAGGVGLAVSTIWMLFPPQGSVALLVAGGLAVLSAVAFTALTYTGYARSLASTTKPSIPNPRPPSWRTRRTARTTSGPGIALSLISGLALGMAPPLLTLSRTGEDGLAPYSAGLFFGLAVLGSTALFAPFFFTFPVRGEPVSVAQYLTGSKTQHLSGLLAGALWIAGSIAALTTSGTLSAFQVQGQLSAALADAVPVLGALWGLLAWREFRGGGRALPLMAAALALWIAGASMVVIAAGFGSGK